MCRKNARDVEHTLCKRENAQVTRWQVYSDIANLARLTPQRFYKHTEPELLREQGDCVVREIIKRDTRQMALNIAKWEEENR